MNATAAALRPLDEAAGAIDRLENYETATDLATAVAEVRDAVERALRIRLRSDPSAPDSDRLSALSRDLPLDSIVRSLRARDMISLEAAGSVHELEAAGARAREGQGRPADADVALQTVARLRKEFGATGPTGAVPEAPVPPREPAAVEAVPPERRGRWMALLGAGLAVLFVAALAWVLVRGGTNDFDAAVTAFRAGRLDSAAVAFQRVLDDRPEDVDALLYLGRIHRREARFSQSAELLRQAAEVDPTDGDVRRELGHLFMDLRQPEAAARQYERALETDPEEPRTWAALIGALRAAGDPRADRLLADAPPEVQAMLGRPQP